MQKVLIHTILLLMLMLSVCDDSIGQKIHTCTSMRSPLVEQQQACLTSTLTDTIAFLRDQRAEMVPMYVHVASGTKALFVISWTILHSDKNRQFPFLRFLPDWYFHPFSTLEKTKYYVFALEKIIV